MPSPTSRHGRPRSLALAVGLVLPAALAGSLVSTPAHAADRARHSHDAFSTTAELRSGTLAHAVARRGNVRVTDNAPIVRRDGRRYQRGTWTSPLVSPGFTLTELIPSWEATTRRDAFVDVQVRGVRPDGSSTRWDRVARWTTSQRWVSRTTYGAQGGDGSRMDVDTWRTPGVRSWQVRVHLHRRAGSRARVVLHQAGAVASRVAAYGGTVSAPGVASGARPLPVPAYSQMVHAGHSPQWGGGGQAWCSPTSVAMVLAYWDALPRAGSYRWVSDDDPAPWVDEVARRVYDHGYDGAGNWAFNTAYAGGQAATAHVTRLRSLRAAERYVADGVPLVISIAFRRGELDNSPISSSNGHLLVVRGFRADGDVVVNDPAADPARGERVRRVYDRAQLEKVWQDASDGMAYVIRG
jgi:hypothetical protein